MPRTSSTQGYVQCYFDGMMVSEEVNCPKLTDAAQTPLSSYGIAVLQHLLVILGKSSQYPITPNSIAVWQASASGNFDH